MHEKMISDGKITLAWQKDEDGFQAKMSGNNADMLEVMSMSYAAFVIDQLAGGQLKAKFVSQVFAQLIAKFGAGLLQTHPELLEKPEVREMLPFLAAISDALGQGPAGVRADVEKVLGKELIDAIDAVTDRRPSVDESTAPDRQSPVDERTAKEKKRDAKLAEISKTMQGGSCGQR